LVVAKPNVAEELRSVGGLKLEKNGRLKFLCICASIRSKVNDNAIHNFMKYSETWGFEVICGSTYTNSKQTEVIDKISFELPYGPIGKLLEGYADRRLQKLFDYRKEATIRNLEGKNT
jgi:hypothetical protein